MVRTIVRRFTPLVFALLMMTTGFLVSQSHAQTPRVVPPPAMDEPVANAARETVVLAGGCFWGVQGVFQHVKGVVSAVSGYAGGGQAAAKYEVVSTGVTGHAESVRVTFDPHRISYGRILQIFFSAAHDPTELNRQGPDTGTQYRSAVFPLNTEQARVAQAYIDQLNQSHTFQANIVTRVEAGHTFYPAEAYHQDYLTLHPDNPYIAINDLPKLAALQRLFPDLYQSEPLLVALKSETKP